MSWHTRIGVLLVSLFLFTGTLEAQRNLATLVGTVKDSSGAVVPNATVTAKNLGTAAVRTQSTGASGDYTFTDLDVGHYSLTGSMTGFKTTLIPDIVLQTGQSARIDIVLELGAVTQEVTVTTTAPLITTTSSDVGQVVDQDVLQKIPLNGRAFWQLTQLTPGATYTPAGSNAYGSLTVIRASGVNVVINGSDPDKTG
jgi:Carboxypeptidase regulatory-like domain